MNNLINFQSQQEQLVLDSREVAGMIDKNHAHLLRDIKCYIEHISTNPKLDSLEFFKPSDYVDSKGEKRPRYEITRKGCELVGNKLTGEKGTIFTAKYINKFHSMEKAMAGIYHISETAIVNNIMGSLESKLFSQIDKRFSMYEENYRPTHANKIDINRYIKNMLGEDREDDEVEKVKERVLLLLDGESWQDIPYKKIIDNLHLVDESVRSIMRFRVKRQLSLFDQN
ncbi:MAG: DNA-binding protein [Peptoclostridium sp.]|uniref:Rha family transcriptional regulator n=1 Tax=Peptoclostridium sp. TaxID=1904860 RepID=UPI00139D9784|nr:Rha family transcriptional regulator [Peptoclostridium sp.]MZQ75222.1 DNA-binding protein [Peptoclostridium sp.]